MQRNLGTVEPIRRMAIEAADGLADRDEFDFIADLEPGHSQDPVPDARAASR
jgi:hypothetical protein